MGKIQTKSSAKINLIGQKKIDEIFQKVPNNPPRVLKDQTNITEYFKVPGLTKVKLKPQCISAIGMTSSKGAQATKKKFLESLKKEGRLPENRKYWKDYMFSCDDNFSEYKVTLLTHKSGLNNKLFYPGLSVGTATIDDNSALTHINVIEGFRRQKIGTQLIKFINERNPSDVIGPGRFVVFRGVEVNSRYRLTEEGAKLIKHCEKQKILSSEQIIFGCPPSPSA